MFTFKHARLLVKRAHRSIPCNMRLEQAPGIAKVAANRRLQRQLRFRTCVISRQAVAAYLCGGRLSGRLRKWPHRVVARDDAPDVGINQTDQVIMMNGNSHSQANDLQTTRAALMGCMVIAAFCAALAHAEDTSIKEDVKRAGAAVGKAAREVGHEAKNIGTEIGQSAKKVGGEIAGGAKQAATEIAQGAKKVGAEIGAGAKTAGRVVGNAARQTAEAVHDAPKNIKESMTGEKKE